MRATSADYFHEFNRATRIAAIRENLSSKFFRFADEGGRFLFFSFFFPRTLAGYAFRFGSRPSARLSLSLSPAIGILRKNAIPIVLNLL